MVNENQMDTLNVPIFPNCISFLNELGLKSYEFISSAARLCCALANGALCGATLHLRNDAASSSDVIGASIEARARYFHEFTQNDTELMGFYVMTRTEGVGTAMSTLLSRFKVLRGVCYYDNACNMAKSTVLRVPWVNNECILVCDRFYYKGHKFSSICDPGSYVFVLIMQRLI